MEPIAHFYDDLGTKAYDMLKEMIVKGDLAPGQKLVQEEIAQLLGVSRTPLLQAISKLSKDHFVVTIPRRGSYVKRFSPAEFLDIFDIRGQLEPMGAYHAAEHISASELRELETVLEHYSVAVHEGRTLDIHSSDNEFHMVIMRCSRNKFLFDIMKNYTNLLCDSKRLLKSPAKSMEEHTGILNALRNHDPNGARELMFYHVNGGARAKLAQLLHERETATGQEARHAEN